MSPPASFLVLKKKRNCLLTDLPHKKINVKKIDKLHTKFKNTNIKEIKNKSQPQYMHTQSQSKCTKKKSNLFIVKKQ